MITNLTGAVRVMSGGVPESRSGRSDASCASVESVDPDAVVNSSWTPRGRPRPSRSIPTSTKAISEIRKRSSLRKIERTTMCSPQRRAPLAKPRLDSPTRHAAPAQYPDSFSTIAGQTRQPAVTNKSSPVVALWSDFSKRHRAPVPPLHDLRTKTQVEVAGRLLRAVDHRTRFLTDPRTI